MADKKPYTIRIEPSLLNEIQQRADDQGETVTAIFEQALKWFLSHAIKKPDTLTAPDQVRDLAHRIERIERIVIGNPEPKPAQVVKRSGSDLITLQEISVLTGYAIGTLSGKLSRLNIKAVGRIDGNRTGLYSKAEILDKVKPN